MPSADELRRVFLLDEPRTPVLYLNGADADANADTGTDPASDSLPCVVAIGAFDGCHKGHADLLRHAVEDAHARGVAAVAVTFDPDPDQVLSTHPAPKLMSLRDRLRALAATGVGVAVVPFTRELAALDHEAFFDNVLAPALDIQAVHVGADFCLGRGGASTVEVMRAWGEQRGMAVLGHELLRDTQNAPITATHIRALIAGGNIAAATELLGRYPVVRGLVRHGRGQGTGMGFPTANIEVPAGMQLPADGVYAGLALVGTQAYPAAINVGLPPMFERSAASAHLEAHILGYTGELYGSTIALAFTDRLRPSRKFASVDELVATVNNDIETVRGQFGEVPVRIG